MQAENVHEFRLVLLIQMGTICQIDTICHRSPYVTTNILQVATRQRQTAQVGQ